LPEKGTWGKEGGTVRTQKMPRGGGGFRGGGDEGRGEESKESQKREGYQRSNIGVRRKG